MIFFFLLSLLSADEFSNSIEQHGDSSINWTQMRLQGSAYVEQNGPTDDYAKQEARALALAHQALKETFDHLQIDQSKNLNSIANEDSKTQRYILAHAKKYKVSQTSYKEPGGVSVHIYWEIHTLLRPVVIERATEDVAATKPTKHTGIIIDARGMKYDPVLFPEILKGNGSTWLSSTGFSQARAETSLPFIYAPHAAHNNVIDRVGNNPVIFLAQSTSNHTITINDSFPTGLSEEDAKAIMANGSVVILIDL
jgi:hypothetical protein